MAAGRLLNALRPPDPFLHDPAEHAINAPLGRYNLYIGGANRRPDGYINLDILSVPGVDVVADVEHLPFRDGLFTRVECDAVLEHVHDPVRSVAEMARVLAPAGYLHVVTPFCHPFHEYPKDYRRFTPDGLRALIGPYLEPVTDGWRTGPTATMILFTLEYVKLLLPNRALRGAAHGVLGWLLSPLRYLDVPLRRNSRAQRLGNHCYLWARKPPH